MRKSNINPALSLLWFPPTTKGNTRIFICEMLHYIEQLVLKLIYQQVLLKHLLVVAGNKVEERKSKLNLEEWLIYKCIVKEDATS